MIGLPQSGDNRPGIMFIRGPEVEVLSPKTLREKVTQLHDQAAQLNQNPWR